VPGTLRLAAGLALASAALPLASLGGWLAGAPLLTGGGRFVPMAPSTALCFLLLAAAFSAALRREGRPAGGRAPEGAAALVAGYGCLVAVAWLTGLPVNPEARLLGELGTVGGHPIGRMSPVTGALFGLAGLSLASLLRRAGRDKTSSPRVPLPALAGAGVLMSGAVFSLGYALGAPLLYDSPAIPLALPTALSFLFLGAALTARAALCDPATGRWYRAFADLPIGVQLRLGLGLILAFVLVVGALTSRGADLLWRQTKTLYDHPLQVRRALGGLEADVLAMRGGMKNLALAESEAESEAILQDIAGREASALGWLAVLEARYLGPPGDVAALRDDFARWRAVRETTIALFREGRTAEAVARVRRGGAGGIHVAAMLGDLRRVDEFSRAMGDELFRRATDQHDTLTRHLVLTVAAVLVLSLGVAYLLLTGIRGPLTELTQSAERFRQGDAASRSRYASANELGALSAAFNRMAEAIEGQLRLQEKSARLADVMLREVEPRDFCRSLLQALLDHTASQVGAIYLLDRQRGAFELFESVGLGAGARARFSVSAREGEVGLALASGRMQRITGIPDDTPFCFAAAVGELKPREIVTLPLMVGGEAVAVVSLASLGRYGTDAIGLLEAVADTLAARMGGVLAYRRAQELAERLEQQNRELEEQKRELASQADELFQQNAELEVQKRQLGEASRLKSAFLSNMSHELRTPLNSVIALSGVLGRRLAGRIPDEEYGYLEVIERNGRHLLGLINDILDLSRIEAGREEIALAPASIGELAGEVAAVLEPQAREKGIALVNRVGDDLPPLVTDPAKCRQILLNLVGNAVKFTQAGSVELSAREENDELLVAVRDTGIGIAADQLGHLFEEFWQADDGASRRFGGTGLGLAIAKRYAELLHGSIAVESEPGRGSVFTLRLPRGLSPSGGGDPRGQAEGGPGRPRGGRDEAPPPGAGRSILLVEDSEPAVLQMTEILAGHGYEVRVARSGAEALAQLAAALPDGVILDLMMPQMDGFEVLRAMRGREGAERLPVLILTAKHVTREELSFLRGNHIYQLIQKGDVNKAALLAAVGRMVAPASPKPPLAGPQPGKPVVLVVEDNPDNRKTLRALLQDDCTVLEAADGRSGVEQARRHRPDAILMDLALPAMDGFAALAAIRADEHLRRTPVIAVTASAMKGDREEILARGFDGYVSKPIDETLLRRTLEAALRKGR
jgi:signal transduction histidine kinase/DNA-binding response OmpR family regulator